MCAVTEDLMGHLCTGSNAVTTALIFTGLLVASATPPCSAGKPATTFFGTISDTEVDELEGLRDILTRVGDECTEVGHRCRAADELFAELSGEISTRNLPIHVVYIDREGEVKVNALFWNRKVTPYLWGVQSLALMVFSEREIPLEVSISTLWQQSGGVSGGLRNVFIPAGERTRIARESQTETRALEFSDLTGPGLEDHLWYARDLFFIEPLSAYRLTIGLPDPEAADVGFREIQVNFSNSTKNSTSAALGLGATLNLDEDSTPTTGGGVYVGNTRINLYLMLNVDIIRPALVKPIADKWGGRFRPSVGLAFGVNIQFWETEEIIFGVNFGHLFGTHGITAGVNIIDPFSDKDVATEVRPYVGVDFRF
jgi:hypothetical protein